MVTKAKLRKSTKALLASGKKEYQARRELDGSSGKVVTQDLKTGKVQTSRFRRKEHFWEFYTLHFGKARDFLLKKGYEQAIPNIAAQELFAEMIPDSDEYVALNQSTLKQLRSRDVLKRTAAAKEIEKLTRSRFHDHFVARHPELVTQLIDALDKETHAKTPFGKLQVELICSLGSIYRRHLADYRIFDAVLPLLQSEDKKVLEFTLMHIESFKDKRKWPAIIDLLANPKTTQPILGGALSNIKQKTGLSIKRKIIPLLGGLLNRRLNLGNRNKLLRAICNLSESRTIDGIVENLASHKLKKELTKWIDQNVSIHALHLGTKARDREEVRLRERKEFLVKQLLKKL